MLKNITKCIFGHTFSFNDTIEFAGLGVRSNESLMRSELWSEDFTMARRGRFYTLNFDKTIGPEYLDDFVMFLLQHKLTYNIFLHDENYFILNENPIALPTVINEKV